MFVNRDMCQYFVFCLDTLEFWICLDVRVG